MKYADEDPQDERVRDVLERLPEPRINLFRMLANAPALIGPTLRLGQTILTGSDLDPEIRELVILHTARVTQADYEWTQHEQIARLVGVSEEKIETVARGDLGGCFDEREGLALRLADEVLRDGAAGVEVVAEAESTLGRAELIEVLLVTGYYAMLAGVMRSVELDIDDVVEKGMLEGGAR